MRVDIEIPTAKLVDGIMHNFPEASYGMALRCRAWNYEKREYVFEDEESGKMYSLNEGHFRNAVQLMYSDKWPKGCTPVPSSGTDEAIDDWLCSSDAFDYDAFVQLAALGEVIYG